MELAKDILVKALADEEKIIIFPNINVSAAELVENTCYKALVKIKEIIDDGRLDDAECFHSIEAIVRIFEDIGSGCDRHDF